VVNDSSFIENYNNLSTFITNFTEVI
jgi:hypothetical protein